MFSFGRKKKVYENDEDIHEMEKIIQTLDKDGNGRIRIVDLEAALQCIDEDSLSKSEKNTQVKKFSE